MTKKTILCVDDEANILNSLKRLLRKEEYDILTAGGGPEGLEILSKTHVDLVITDHRMPDMLGTEFLQQVREKYPCTVRTVLTGYADSSVILESIDKGAIYRFFIKPWNDEEMKTAIRQCLAYHDYLNETSGSC